MFYSFVVVVVRSSPGSSRQHDPTTERVRSKNVIAQQKCTVSVRSGIMRSRSSLRKLQTRRSGSRLACITVPCSPSLLSHSVMCASMLFYLAPSRLVSSIWFLADDFVSADRNNMGENGRFVLLNTWRTAYITCTQCWMKLKTIFPIYCGSCNVDPREYLLSIPSTAHTSVLTILV